MNGRALAVLASLAACSGSGSDIGPKLPAMPGDSFKVQVLDDAGRGICGARVLVPGVAPAVTGSSGRTDLLASPSGFLVCTIDARAASAVAGDQLGVLTFGAVFGGGELPAPVHLPDLSASTALTLTAGVLVASTQLDDSASSGALLTLPAGTAVSAGGAASVTLRTGSLGELHLPGTLPQTSGAWLTSRAIMVDPPEAAFAPAIGLSIPDDLQLPANGTATLFFLDPVGGSWVPVGQGTPQGGSIAAANAVGSGGSYVFAVAIPATTSVSARVLDLEGQPLATVLVSSGIITTKTDADGRFILTGLPGTLADGSARPASFELRGGRLQLPFGATYLGASLPAFGTDLVEVRLDTHAGGNLRVQQVVRSRAVPVVRCSLGSLDGKIAMAALSDASGTCTFEDVPAGTYGYTLGFPQNSEKVFETGVEGFLDSGRPWTDIYQFFGTSYWYTGSRNVRVRTIDSVAGGPVRGGVVRGSTPGTGFVGVTNESGQLITDRGCDGRATASLATTTEGRTTIAAFSVERPDCEHLNMPLQRADRTPLGNFDRHGLVSGLLAGGDPAAEHRLRTTRPLEVSEWFDDVFLGLAVQSRLPVKTDPQNAGLQFRAGVAVPRGNLAAAEGTTAGGAFTLTKLGVAAGFAVSEGSEQHLDLPLDLAADTAFPLAGVLAGIALPANLLAFDLGVRRPDGTAVDVVRGLAGNVAVNGNDAAVTLPALTGSLAGHEWLVALSASGPGGTGTVTQRALQRIAAGSIVPAPLLGAPVVMAPADGGSVPADGFTVQFTLPSGTSYATLELRSVLAGDTRCWQAVVPPDQTSFTFPKLPAEAANPLLAGRTYALTVSAFRIDTGPILQSATQYRDLISFLFSVDAFERGVTAMSSHAITITLQ